MNPGFLNPSNIVSLIIACIVGLEVAERLALVSKKASLAVRIGAVCLAVESAWGFLTGFIAGILYELPMGEFVLRYFPQLLGLAFWVSLGLAALALINSAQSGPASQSVGLKPPEVR